MNDDGTTYWRLVEPYWTKVNIYGLPEEFLSTFAAVPRDAGTLLAAHWCQSEVRNGGHHQFFTNATGILAPEAACAFAALGRGDLASLVQSAMDFFGSEYPRMRAARTRALDARPGKSREEWDPFYRLDDEFYACLKRESFERSADRFATALG